MRKIKPKVFIACDTTSILKISKIIKETKIKYCFWIQVWLRIFKL